MDEYIKREDAINALLDRFWDGKETLREILNSIPAADVEPVVHAEWAGIEYDGYADGSPVYSVWECSHCGEEHKGEESTLTNYCPNCGAKMNA